MSAGFFDRLSTRRLIRSFSKLDSILVACSSDFSGRRVIQLISAADAGNGSMQLLGRGRVRHDDGGRTEIFAEIFFFKKNSRKFSIIRNFRFETIKEYRLGVLDIADFEFGFKAVRIFDS